MVQDDLDALQDVLQNEISKLEQEIRSEVRATQDSTANALTTQLEGVRTTFSTTQKDVTDTLVKTVGELGDAQSSKLEDVTKLAEGIGKVESLAADMKNLERILTNVNVYGTWGEVQLGTILKQILAPHQYAKNVRPHTGSEIVEYAVRLPGKDGNPNTPIWLPIDSKFPMTDYRKLTDATKTADKEAEKSAIRSLKGRIKSDAKDIYERYVSPPDTTEFAIMFLPTEGLYTEVLRQPALGQELIQDYKIIVTGPTTLAAILFGYLEGFQTLAFQKHSSEIKNLLAAVKTVFGKYHNALQLTQKQLRQALNNLEKAGKHSQEVVDKLSNLEDLTPLEAAERLGIPEIKLGKETDHE